MNLKVLYLDDERAHEQVRAGLSELGDGWRFEFYSNPRSAVLGLSMKRFDAVVVTQAIASSTEPHFLERVRENHPTVVRILLHENPTGDINLRSVGLAHQALVKPSDASEICKAVQRAMRLTDLFLTREFHKQIVSIESLPTPPATYQALVREFQTQEVSVDRVVEIMSKDLGLMSKLLQIVNSAFFGLASEVKDLKHAVTLLGLDQVRTLALASGVFNRFEVEGIGFIMPDWLAEHGTAVGKRAKGIAHALGLEQSQCDSAMLAGLLHDTGKLIQLAFFREKFQRSIDHAVADELPLHEAEQFVVGVDHSRVGAHLLSLWGLPYPIVEAVAFHHDPLQSGDPVVNVLTAVHIADAITWDNYRDRPKSYNPTGGALDRTYLAVLGIEDETVEKLRELSIAAPV